VTTDRAALEAEWLRLTREVLPALAGPRGWPVRNDHCFQRILLDNACGGRWYDRIIGRPAYRHADPTTLAEAVILARALEAGEADLFALNRASLTWRRKA
jgi:hypothetical protein